MLLCLIIIKPVVEAKTTLDYRKIQLQIASNASTTYAVAVLDRREVITKQNQKPTFVGYIRSAVGIAYPIGTKSGNTFSDDIAYTISQALQKSGAKVTEVPTNFSMDSQQVIEKLKSSNADKLILVILDEWRSDTRPWHTKVATEMLWDLKLQIFDINGTIVGENKNNGRDGGIDPSGTGSAKKIQVVIDKYYKEKMESLFSIN